VVVPDLRSADSLSEPAGVMLVVVARPDAPSVPGVMLMGPAAIGTCDTATLQVSHPPCPLDVVDRCCGARCFCPDARVDEMVP